MTRIFKAIGAGAVLVALIAVPPIFLVTAIGNPWPAGGVTWSAPLTDQALLGLLAVLLWAFWAQMVVCFAVEAWATVSDRAVDVRLPVLGVQQDLARVLIGAILTSTVAAPIAAGLVTHNADAAVGDPATRTSPSSTSAAPAPRDAAGAAVEERSVTSGTGAASSQTRAETSRDATAPEAEPVSVTVTVERGDTLWSLAEELLGDGEQWTAIATANAGETMVDGSVFTSANSIRAGWQLRVPGVQPDQVSREAARGTAAASGPEARETVRVEAGDTLWGISEEQLGDGARYPELVEATRELTQPGGDRLTDPDHIEPGWTVATGRGVPAQQPTGSTGRTAPDPEPEAASEETSAASGGGIDRSPDGVLSERGASRPGQAAVSGSTSTAAAPQAGPAAGEGVTVLRALLAGAACLSVGVLGLVAVNRRRQWRGRRVGRAIASTPTPLSGVEQAIVEAGSRQAQSDVEFLDRALRHVAACCQATGVPVPQLGAAVVGGEDLTLLFTEPAVGEAPEGWKGTEDRRAWILSRSTFLDDDLDAQAAPYPALVSVGLDDGDRTWLLDLEALGVCGVRGDRIQVADLMRFLVAELAVNRWSEGSEVLLADGFAQETVALNPARLRRAGVREALARASTVATQMREVEQNLDADVLSRRRDGLLLDSTNPIVVAVAPWPHPDARLADDAEDGAGAAAGDTSPGAPLGDLLRGLGQARSRVVLIHGEGEVGGEVGGEPESGSGSVALELVGPGLVRVPLWGVTLKALMLPADEAVAMAALVESTSNVDDEPVPDAESDEGPLGKYARADGSLREAYTEPRRAEGGDRSSLLPDPDQVYLASAATTPQDLAAAAPGLSSEVRAEIESIDPTLDQDVADFLDETSPRPKVHLLGPVDVSAANGGDPSAIDNLAGTISFIAYLACQDRGVSGERAAAAFGWKTQRTVQNRATNARFLLGSRADGSDWLPDASTSDGARRGTPTYELLQGRGGVLNSADLFVRLRFRAQQRGDEGCEQDLVTALSMVTGAPFEAATDRRFPWLFTGQRHDDILVAAIHDVAHVLATRAVATGRTDLVRLACETARSASPHSDIAWLDQAAAIEADSGREAADALVREEVLDRFDEDLPERTESILDRRGWLAG